MAAKMSLRKIIVQYGTIIAFVLITVLFSIFVDGFVAGRNLLNILGQVALLVVISEGFTMCLIVGELDLSFASLASLASVGTGALILAGVNFWLAILIIVLGGILIGIFNGLLITKVGIPALIATLAMGSILVGLIYLFTGGVSLYGEMPEGFLFLGRGKVFGIPMLVIIMLIIAGSAHIFINKFKTGKYMQATGANKLATKLSGINTDKYKILAFVLSGVGAALTGVLLTAKLGTANPEAASGFMMDCFAAALMGETLMGTGRAKPLGTLVGVLIIGVLSNGMTLAGAAYYMQDITKGAIIILAVAISAIQEKRNASF